MKMPVLLGVLLVVLLALPVAVSTAPAPPPPATEVFGAALSGDEEVPRVATQAFGEATFEFDPRANTVRYTLTVVNLENTDMGHIHIAARGQNGAITVWLYPASPPARRIAGRTSADIAYGTFTAANLTGPLARQPITALLAAMRGGTAYVNVHTARFPGGEIRGQISQ